MTTITINVSEEVNRDFREVVKKKIGSNKGALGKAVEEALKEWIEEEKQKNIAERQKKMLTKGLYSLNGKKFNREEIYER